MTGTTGGAGSGPALFPDLDGLADAAPMDLGVTGWVEVGPADVAAFRRATWAQPGPDGDGDGDGDGSDPGPDGEEVPPLMLLALTNRFLPELMQVPGAASGVNYGAETTRFGPPARTGQRVRGRAALVSAQPVGHVPGTVQTSVEITVEVDGRDTPACVVRSLSRWMG